MAIKRYFAAIATIYILSITSFRYWYKEHTCTNWLWNGKFKFDSSCLTVKRRWRCGHYTTSAMHSCRQHKTEDTWLQNIFMTLQSNSKSSSKFPFWYAHTVAQFTNIRNKQYLYNKNYSKLDRSNTNTRFKRFRIFEVPGLNEYRCN